MLDLRQIFVIVREKKKEKKKKKKKETETKYISALFEFNFGRQRKNQRNKQHINKQYTPTRGILVVVSKKHP